MDPLYLFYTVISISLVTIVVIFGVIAYYAVKTLKIAQEFLRHSSIVARDVRIASDSLQVGFLGNALKIANLFFRRR